ncbi:MAG: hypothetical protein KGN74_03590, partial [Gemmatimonadota bacterium]|nr:hypothetical protein [Gemmatimonadota bacterium]
MAERDWSKELAKIDKQLGAMSDDELAAKTPVPAKPGEGGKPGPAPAPAPKSAKASDKPAATTGSFGVFARLTLSVVLGLAILAWPYEARCGFGLAAYLAAVVVVVSGGWSAV